MAIKNPVRITDRMNVKDRIPIANGQRPTTSEWCDMEIARVARKGIHLEKVVQQQQDGKEAFCWLVRSRGAWKAPVGHD